MDSHSIYRELLASGRPPTLSLSEAAELVGLKSPGAAYQAYYQRRFPVFVRKIGGKLTVSLAAVAAWLAEHSPEHSTASNAPEGDRRE